MSEQHNLEMPGRLDRVEDLMKILDAPTKPPTLPPARERASQSQEERQTLDEARLNYLATGVVVATPQLGEIVRKVQFSMIHNRRRVSGRTGVMISGGGTMGKTTAAIAAMRTVMARHRRQYPEVIGAQLPVAYIEVPSSGTAKGVMQRIGGTMGIPISGRDTFTLLLDGIADFLVDVRTRLVVVDEVHHLNDASHAAADAADVLKDLSNKVPATFVYAGINIHSGGLLCGDRGEQISGRFTLTRLTRYGYDTEDEHHAWRQTIRGFEKAIPLYDNPVGTLDALAEELHERTKGKIGTLANLLTGAAEMLITNEVGPGDERITGELLDLIPVDLDADVQD